MRINTNVGALTASKNAFVNNVSTEASMRKLSSGLRIARAGDDAAGLSIANTYRSQHRNLQMGVDNAEKENARLQIAEGALQTIERIRERLDELVVQGTTGTEVTALETEITRIIADTNIYLSGDRTVNVGSSTITISLGAALTSASNLAAINTALAAIGRVRTGSSTRSRTRRPRW